MCGVMPHTSVMTFYDFEVRIAYADTDRMGVVYYANYLVLFERGRTEFLRSIGLRYRDLEEKQKMFMPAMDAHVEYFAPARYDDLIRVRTFITALGVAHIVFGSEIYDESKKRIAQGSVKLVLVNAAWKPTRFPKDLHALLLAHRRE
jgi:acyl-CoA thioester hydrolase